VLVQDSEKDSRTACRSIAARLKCTSDHAYPAAFAIGDPTAKPQIIVICQRMEREDAASHHRLHIESEVFAISEHALRRRSSMLMMDNRYCPNEAFATPHLFSIARVRRSGTMCA
jgi:hypothetical protein